jgi:hypothetical protein
VLVGQDEVGRDVSHLRHDDSPRAHPDQGRMCL